MEYDLTTFTQEIVKEMETSPFFPFSGYGYYVSPITGARQRLETKHKDRNPLHLRDAVFKNLVILPSESMQTFDIGNEFLEAHYPYYHILDQARMIRKKGKGTAKTKGSQANVEVAKRNYSKVSWNGKTFTKEYERNVRGTRNPKKGTKVYIDYAGNQLVINRDANSYLNLHYKYMDKMCDDVANIVAERFEMKLKRKQDTGLAEEFFAESDFTQGLLDTLQSFNIGD